MAVEHSRKAEFPRRVIELYSLLHYLFVAPHTASILATGNRFCPFFVIITRVEAYLCDKYSISHLMNRTDRDSPNMGIG